jgi:hypothetical protein
MPHPQLQTLEGRFGHAEHRLIAAQNPSSFGDRTLPTGAVALGIAVAGHVNHGRWIADCPDPDCGGAELVSFDNPYLFCCECRNAHVQHDLIPVKLPKPGVRGEIEAYLRARPDVASRNWSGEKVAVLRDENRARKIRLLKDEEG